MLKPLFSTATVFGFLGVALGAFGAHALKGKIPDEMIAIWHTGTEYHLVHAVMALVCGVVSCFVASKALRVAGWLFLAGIVLFSGSLYALALTGTKALGAITPLGGLCFMGGWIALLLSAKDLPTASETGA